MRFNGLCLALLFYFTSDVQSHESAIWQVSPDVCFAQGASDRCALTVTIQFKQTLNGTHCLYLDSQRLQCFDRLPTQLVKNLTLTTTSLLNLLDEGGLTVAEKHIVIQYLKRKRKRTRAPWSLF